MRSYVFISSLIAACLGARASATVLIFDIDGIGNQQGIPLAYGDHVGSGGAGDDPTFHYGAGGTGTSHIGIDYWTYDTGGNQYQHGLRFWNFSYGDLVNVAYMWYDAQIGHLEFIPDPGYAVTINGFDFAGWAGTYQGFLNIVDGNRYIMWSFPNFAAPGSGHASFSPAITGSGRIAIEWGSSWNMGIDNISISEQPIVPPTGFNVFRGVLEGGNVSSLIGSDDNYVVVKNGVTALRTESPITVEVLGTSPTQAVTILKFNVENRVSITGLNQYIDMYDWTASAYEQQDARAATTTDGVVALTATNPNRFIQGGTKSLKSRMRIRPAGPVFTNTWRSFLDQAVWIENT